MTQDLWMLVSTGVLALAIPLLYIARLVTLPGGFQWVMGNRDRPFEEPGWVERSRRAHANLVDNLAPFAILVLVAHVTGVANAETATASATFLGARLAHAIVYAAGIPYLRAIAFGIGLSAEITILRNIVERAS